MCNRFYVYLVFVLISCSALFSCSTKRTSVSDNDSFCNAHSSVVVSSENSKILSELSGFNNRMISEKPITKMSWLKFCAVAGADCIAFYEGAKIGGEGGGYIGAAVGHPVAGAVIGAVLVGGACGVGASYLAGKATGYQTTAPTLPSDETTAMVVDEYLLNSLYAQIIDNYQKLEEICENQLDLNPIASDLDLPVEAIEMGALHNELLGNLFPDVDGIKTKNGNQELQGSSVEIMVFSDTTLRNQCRNYLLSCSEAPQQLATGTLSDKVMALYYDLMNCSMYDAATLVDYANMYHSVVEGSMELTAEEKNYIYTGLAVSLFSYNYWQNYDFFD